VTNTTGEDGHPSPDFLPVCLSGDVRPVDGRSVAVLWLFLSHAADFIRTDDLGWPWMSQRPGSSLNPPPALSISHHPEAG